MYGLAISNAQKGTEESSSVNLKVFIVRSKSCLHAHNCFLVWPLTVVCTCYDVTDIIYEERAVKAKPVVKGLRALRDYYNCEKFKVVNE